MCSRVQYCVESLSPTLSLTGVASQIGLSLVAREHERRFTYVQVGWRCRNLVASRLRTNVSLRLVPPPICLTRPPQASVACTPFSSNVQGPLWEGVSDIPKIRLLATLYCGTVVLRRYYSTTVLSYTYIVINRLAFGLARSKKRKSSNLETVV